MIFNAIPGMHFHFFYLTTSISFLRCHGLKTSWHLLHPQGPRGPILPVEFQTLILTNDNLRLMTDLTQVENMVHSEKRTLHHSSLFLISDHQIGQVGATAAPVISWGFVPPQWLCCQHRSVQSPVKSRTGLLQSQSKGSWLSQAPVDLRSNTYQTNQQIPTVTPAGSSWFITQASPTHHLFMTL